MKFKYNNKNYKLRTDSIIMLGAILAALLLTIIPIIIITKTNTQTTDELIATAKCVDYHECQAIYNINKNK